MLSKIEKGLMILVAVAMVPTVSFAAKGERDPEIGYFELTNGADLRELGNARTRQLLTRVRGKGQQFGDAERRRYCELKRRPESIQWVLNDLRTGDEVASSENADVLFFGASVSKLFVAAALLDKQEGRVSDRQLQSMVKLIVVSDNVSWKKLQREVGEDGTSRSGREAVQGFVEKMGYPSIKGFQGWLKKPDGSKVHGNELNAQELSKFLYDTYQQRYPGAEVLWKIMHATKTGRGKIDKYTPRTIYIGGKTGTYSGPNESPNTIHHRTIKARNHAAVVTVGDDPFGISILANTGKSEDVAIMGGGLMREYLDVGEPIVCL